jgi:hypothetical protein
VCFEVDSVDGRGKLFLEGSLDIVHQRASYASGDFDAKYIPGIEVPIPGIARFQFTVLSSCGIPNSPSVNFELTLT